MNFILCGAKDEMVSDFMLASFSLTKESDNENNFYQPFHTNQIYCDQYTPLRAIKRYLFGDLFSFNFVFPFYYFSCFSIV